MNEPVIKERGGPSIVWLIPILTALIGVWLIIHTLADKGPLVTITFRTAEGIEVGKTRIKYKSLDIGLDEGVRFSSDFSRVSVACCSCDSLSADWVRRKASRSREARSRRRAWSASSDNREAAARMFSCMPHV